MVQTNSDSYILMKIWDVSYLTPQNTKINKQKIIIITFKKMDTIIEPKIMTFFFKQENNAQPLVSEMSKNYSKYIDKQ